MNLKDVHKSVCESLESMIPKKYEGVVEFAKDMMADEIKQYFNFDGMFSEVEPSFIVRMAMMLLISINKDMEIFIEENTDLEDTDNLKSYMNQIRALGLANIINDSYQLDSFVPKTERKNNSRFNIDNCNDIETLKEALNVIVGMVYHYVISCEENDYCFTSKKLFKMLYSEFCYVAYRYVMLSIYDVNIDEFKNYVEFYIGCEKDELIKELNIIDNTNYACKFALLDILKFKSNVKKSASELFKKV